MFLFLEKAWLKDSCLEQSYQGWFAADIRLLQDLRDPTTKIGKSNVGFYHRYHILLSLVARTVVKIPRSFTVLCAGRKCPCNPWHISRFSFWPNLCQELKKFPGLGKQRFNVCCTSSRRTPPSIDLKVVVTRQGGCCSPSPTSSCSSACRCTWFVLVLLNYALFPGKLSVVCRTCSENMEATSTLGCRSHVLTPI